MREYLIFKIKLNETGCDMSTFHYVGEIYNDLDVAKEEARSFEEDGYVIGISIITRYN